ncbi:NHERF family PDZ scaffold protein 4b [Brachionichthys hirsutus]|uniref:NHERF family PDZ scaffold protein 4b n=1 Tax=Brachionichthys hirsutus TaxID=412623 RepID=UPI0036047B84
MAPIPIDTRLLEVLQSTEKFTFNPKEGIDNPAMIVTDADSRPGVRLCVLKREEGESYGFHMRVERGQQGHIIGNVASGGIAARSGLQSGDRLLEVNSCYVDDVPHPEVARKIKLSGNQLCFLVLDGEEYEEALSQGQDLRGLARTRRGEGCTLPRLCHIAREPVSGLGLSFTPLEGEKGRFSVSLVKGGAAERAGVCQGDHLVWMNGAVVCDLTHAALTRMMKKCGDRITVLVIDSESEKHHLKERMPILPAVAVPHNLPYRARKRRLICGPKGYGLLLRLEETTSGRSFHVLREMDKGGPAAEAGISDGELLLEVNGEAVEALKHQEIVDRVRMSRKEVSLTTIAQQGLAFYTKLGLSPLLFCEDDANESSTSAAAGGSSKPRKCSLQKGPLGFGFNLGCVPHRPGTFISQVTSGGSGQRAGLLVGDVLMEVNGKNVEGKDLEDVIMLMKEGGRGLSLLVGDWTGSSDGKQADTAIKQIPCSEQEEDDYELSCL